MKLQGNIREEIDVNKVVDLNSLGLCLTLIPASRAPQSKPKSGEDIEMCNPSQEIQRMCDIFCFQCVPMMRHIHDMVLGPVHQLYKLFWQIIAQVGFVAKSSNCISANMYGHDARLFCSFLHSINKPTRLERNLSSFDFLFQLPSMYLHQHNLLPTSLSPEHQ